MWVAADEEEGAAPPAKEEGEVPENESKDKGDVKEDLQRIVFVIKDGKAFMREVKTGIADNSYIVIEEGLEPGEEVVSGSYRAITRQLKHDVAVTVKKPGKDNRENQKKS